MRDGPGSSVSRETGGAPPAAETVFGERLPLARRYVSWLTGAGIERGLIGPREVPRIWERHVLNCAVVAELVGRGRRVADIGSGAGLPGLAMAISRPDLTMVLIEPMLRRADYLQEVVEDLGLESVSVVRSRAEHYMAPEPFDVVTARAVAKLSALAEWSMPLLRPGGTLLALKGQSVHEELRGSEKALRRADAERWSVESAGSDVLNPATVVAVVTKRVRPAAHTQKGAGRPGRKS
ncbi:16S rRNA (guanine(527)-N(7))-methyltransferase RsmG [Phytoactinopolyspora alkaliphila]|uniref:Ribosomal RNA small subunit methyltransferase G n=1 Tax=Phytoactinopolyspora alkaliphila TaxID=1783498 RepID=A0A6N9YKS1_9ACTN|nr:16S rRNA (guanine(527)-N(7))-methyltransferase RsmG [Phytoactinopolyspora alkaliphila]